MGDSAKAKAYKLVYDLRMAGFIVETDYMNRSVKAQMKYANKLDARYTIIIGENELETNTGRIKNMETGEQTEVALDTLADFIK
jgi:histidyl-tRNA synthetase